MSDSDTVEREDPPIIDSEPADAPPKGYLAEDNEPSELAEVTFEAGGSERTISVGELFIADNGQVVGEIDRITRQQQDTSKRLHRYPVIHHVWIDYSVGDHGEASGTGGIPLGETAKQMAAGDMTTAN